MKSIVCFGEVLWDMLPTGKELGGAPLKKQLDAVEKAAEGRQ